MSDKIVKRLTIDGKFQLTQFESGTCHIDELPKRTNPLELTSKQADTFKKFLTSSVQFAWENGESRPVLFH